MPIQFQFLIAILLVAMCLLALARGLRRAAPPPKKPRRRERRLRQRRTLHDRRKAVRSGASRRQKAGRRAEDQWDDVHSRY